MQPHRPLPAPALRATLAALVALAALQPARADVTVQETTSFELSIIKAHSNTTEYVSGDKQRRDTDMHCEGMMSLFCGNAQSGEIVRLDKDVTWSLAPKKKEYRENHFPTPAERAQMQAQLQANLDKLKQCPATQQANAAPDTSKCQMSPPKFDSRQTDQHATLIGHDARLSQLTLTQSCRNPDTGDTCDFVMTMDAWLTQDQVPGSEDRKAFRQAYMKKLGLDDPNSQSMQQLKQFLAPYSDGLKELAGKASDFKGYPLKSAVRISFGGAQCQAAKNARASGGGGSTVGDAGAAAGNAAASATAGAAGSAAGQAASNAAGNSVAGGILGSAASAFGSKLASGLFAKKSAPAAAPAPAATAPADPSLVQVAQIQMEVTSMTEGAIPASEFEVPAGWTLVTPKSRPEKEFSCPSQHP